MKPKLLAGLLLAVFASNIAAADNTIRVVIWDEQQPSQKEAYPVFLGEYIAAYLKKQAGAERHVRFTFVKGQGPGPEDIRQLRCADLVGPRSEPRRHSGRGHADRQADQEGRDVDDCPPFRSLGDAVCDGNARAVEDGRDQGSAQIRPREGSRRVPRSDRPPTAEAGRGTQPQSRLDQKVRGRHDTHHNDSPELLLSRLPQRRQAQRNHHAAAGPSDCKRHPEKVHAGPTPKCTTSPTTCRNRTP